MYSAFERQHVYYHTATYTRLSSKTIESQAPIDFNICHILHRIKETNEIYYLSVSKTYIGSKINHYLILF